MSKTVWPATWVSEAEQPLNCPMARRNKETSNSFLRSDGHSRLLFIPCEPQEQDMRPGLESDPSCEGRAKEQRGSVLRAPPTVAKPWRPPGGGLGEAWNPGRSPPQPTPLGHSRLETRLEGRGPGRAGFSRGPAAAEARSPHVPGRPGRQRDGDTDCPAPGLGPPRSPYALWTQRGPASPPPRALFHAAS